MHFLCCRYSNSALDIEGRLLDLFFSLSLSLSKYWVIKSATRLSQIAISHSCFALLCVCNLCNPLFINQIKTSPLVVTRTGVLKKRLYNDCPVRKAMYDLKSCFHLLDSALLSKLPK